MALIVGTRGSKLALWQAEWARARLEQEGFDVRIEVIRTEGDRNQASAFADIGGKGVFTKEVDEALLSGRTHLSVHSLKDLPTELPDGLALGAVSPRADVRDALVAGSAGSLDSLPEGARVGTSSLRRQALLRSIRPDLDLQPLRGNVDTRLRKLESEGLDAIVLASAGLKRLGFEARISAYLPAEVVVPAPGQGAMGIAVREDDADTLSAVRVLNDAGCRACVTAERSALAELGGGCRVPLGAWGRIAEGELTLDAVVAHPDGSEVVRASGSDAPERARELGEKLAADLDARGARKILAEVLG